MSPAERPGAETYQITQLEINQEGNYKMKTTVQTAHTTDVVPEFEIVTITPGRAAELLANNNHNRSVNSRSVDRLTATITAGEWKFNAQPIQIAKDGTLLDGQHRLLACVKANRAIQSLIIWNAQMDSQETMDMGKSRNVADILRLRGYKNQTAVAALGRRVALAEAYGFKAGITISFREVSNGAILRAAERTSELSRYVNYAKTVADLCKFNSGLTGYLVWWLDQVDREDSDYFWDKLFTGDGLQTGQGIYALRQFALNRDVKNRGTYLHNIQTAGIVLKAWNRFRSGEPVARLNFRVGGSRPEEIPDAI